MTEVVLGIDPQLQLVIVGGIIGFVSGFVSSQVAVFMQRWWRNQGKVRCPMDNWEAAVTEGDVVKVYRFRARFYNEKDVSVSIWNLRIVLLGKDGQDIGEFPPHTYLQGEVIEVLDLPSRVTVSKLFEISRNGLKSPPLFDEWIKRADKVALKGDFPGGDEFTATTSI